MFNKERIENLEKRVKELERKEDVSRLSEDRSKRLIHALVDSNNEVVKRIFDDVYVTSVYGVGVFQPPKAGDIHASNAVFSGEVFKQAVFIRESLNERIKKLRQRLKKSSIRYRDLKEIISHNGLKSV